jgi:hypothetical protein
MSVIPAFGRLKLEDYKFLCILGYIGHREILSQQKTKIREVDIV